MSAAQFGAVFLQHDDVKGVFTFIILRLFLIFAVGVIRAVEPGCPLLFQGDELSVRVENGTAEIAVG